MTSAGPTMELSTLSGFQTSHFRNAHSSCLQDSRNAESRNADGLSPFGIFSKASIVATRPLEMDGPADFVISGFQTPKCLWVFTLGTPEVPIPEMSMAPDLRHVSQPMDGSICFGVFTMEIPDPLSSRLSISRFPEILMDSFGTFFSCSRRLNSLATLPMSTQIRRLDGSCAPPELWRFLPMLGRFL
jgi:hypothetical protein